MAHVILAFMVLRGGRMTPMLTTSKRNVVIGSIAAISGLLMALLVHHAVSSSRNEDLFPLQVPQSAISMSSGVEIALLGATFSGSGTWLQVEVELQDDSVGAVDVVAATIPS